MRHWLGLCLLLLISSIAWGQTRSVTLCAEEMEALRLPIREGADASDAASLVAAIPRLEGVISSALQSDTATWGRPDWTALIKVYLLLGYCHDGLAQYLDSKLVYVSAMAIAERENILDPDIVFFLYGPLGNVYSRLEEDAQAALMLERCIALLEDSAAYRQAARRTNDLAISLQSRGLLREGVSVLRHALAYSENTEDTDARLHQIMTGILLDSFERAPDPILLSLAGAHADSSYKLFQGLYGSDPDFEESVATICWLLGKWASLGGNWSVSERYFERAIKANASSDPGPNRGLAKVLVQYAEMRLRQNNLPAALALYQQLLHALVPDCPSEDESVNPTTAQLYPDYTLIDGLCGKAEAVLRQCTADNKEPSCLHTAWEACRLAYEAEDTFRALYTYDEDKLSLAAESHDRMELGMELLYWLRSHRDPVATDEAIYQLFERNQGQLLGDYLRALALGGLVPSHLRRQELAARQAIHESSHALAADSNGLRVRELREQLRQAGMALQAVKDTIQSRHPGYYAFRYATKMIPLARLQNELLDNSLGSVQYFWGRRAVYRLVVLKDKVMFDRIGNPDTIAVHLQWMANLVEESFDDGKVAVDLHELHKLLWPPPSTGLPLRIAVIPDGPLWQLPFETLLTEPDAQLGYGSSYLIRKHSIHYAFSASSQWWLEQREMQAAVKSGYLGLMPGLDKVPGLSLPQKDRPTLTDFVRRYGGELYQGSDATRFGLLGADGCASVLHINSHAFWNFHRPYDSFICLESGSSHGEVDTLDLGDIMSMAPKGQVVILEACQSGVGNLLSGEGMQSLAKGFIVAGASAAICTNRNVDAACSAKLIDRFISGLENGETIDQTLRAAKLAYLQDEDLEGKALLPWVWGAYRPFGAMSPLKLPPPRPQNIGWLMASALALASILLFFVARLRGKGSKP